MKNELPKRKHPRLDYYDYSSQGAYFITICVQNRRHILSEISRGVENTSVNLTEYGKIVEKQLLLIEQTYPFVKIDEYVIMPNHIHVIMIFGEITAGASPRPTVMDVVCSFKSLTTREYKKMGNDDKLFQTSFYEHIIRDRNDYNEIRKYIYENPMNWETDELNID